MNIVVTTFKILEAWIHLKHLAFSWIPAQCAKRDEWMKLVFEKRLPSACVTLHY